MMSRFPFQVRCEQATRDREGDDAETHSLAHKTPAFLLNTDSSWLFEIKKSSVSAHGMKNRQSRL